MSNKYSHLLSPLKIGNVVLKNRMLSTMALPHMLQGPENFPSDAIKSFYANLAKNGAAIVTCRRIEATPIGKPPRAMENKPMVAASRTYRLPTKEIRAGAGGGRVGPPPQQNLIDNPGIQNSFAQVADAIHFYGGKASVALSHSDPPGWTISDISTPLPKMRGYYNIELGKEMPVELMQEWIADTTKKAQLYQALGFDMVNIYMTYRSSNLACALSPVFNKREDKYGGSRENRARFALELFQSIKKACGQDFLIEAQMSGEEEAPGGFTIEDTIAYLKTWEGVLDIVQLRGWDASASHPTGFNSQKRYPLTLCYAEAIKKAGVKIATAPVGGFQDLDLSEEYIATGKTDMIAMGRALFCDPEYGQKAYEGRGEDVVPCIRCNKCHDHIHRSYAACSVNPTVGIGHKLKLMIDEPKTSKKVAVIGGGPAGMEAAIIAAKRGHKVTLYEKNYFLGGQLRHADYTSFKWPLRDFKDYLIRQVAKAGVEVLLSTEATPEMIKAKGYDAIMVATGAEPNVPDIPGAHGNNVWMPIDVYGHEKELGESVVVVGGSEIGVETGMYLAENGHKVTVLTRQEELATDATAIHYIEQFTDAWEALETFSFITEATTTGISKGKVNYTDAKGKEKTVKADSVVISGGMNPRQEEALKFYGSADQFFVIGDCNSGGSVLKCMRSAFSTASQL